MEHKKKDLILELTSILEPCPYCLHRTLVSIHPTISPYIKRIQIDCPNDACHFGINQYFDSRLDLDVIIRDVSSAWHDACIDVIEVSKYGEY